MRLFKSSAVNWKYFVGEILLIFFGISLAIWFNNWNTSNTINENKRIAIDKIEEEIQNNLSELHSAREVNLKILYESMTLYIGILGIPKLNWSLFHYRRLHGKLPEIWE